ncbi:MAG: hypothetical protein ABW200_08150 [Hyphomicrobiaceae bacterium]|jgi:hypothetical protein
MQTILGTAYTPPTPYEFEALVRQAHRERAEATREMWRALFRWRREAKAEPATCASPRPCL